MTIGLQGDWGSGKTSLMNLIQANLEKEPCIQITFNTWMYSQMANRDRLPVSMLMNLIKKLRDEVAKDNDKWPSAETRDVLRRLGRGLTIAAGSLASTAPVPGAAVAANMERIVDAFTDSKETTDEAQLFERIRDDIAALVDSSLKNTKFRTPNGKAPRVIFYIDDLDRLEPVRAIELLEVLKNLLDIPQCVFVLAIDFDVVARGLKMRKGYELAGDEDKSFFDKIIQVPYRMPTHSYESWKLFQRGIQGIFQANYAKQLSSMFHTKNESSDKLVDDRVKKLLEHSVRGNPRSVKRLLNLVSLSVKLSKIHKQNKALGTNEICQVIVLTAIQMSCEPILKLICKHQKDPYGLIMALCLADQLIDHLENDQTNLENIDEQDASFDDHEKFEQAKSQIVDSACEIFNKNGTSEPRFQFGNIIRESADAREKLETGLDDLWEFILQRQKDKLLMRRLEKDVPILAELLFEAVDSSKADGKLDKDELKSFAIAVAATQTTSVDRGDTGDSTSPVERYHVGFQQLMEDKLIDKQVELKFRHVKFMDQNIWVKPDWSHSGKSFRVIVDAYENSGVDENEQISLMQATASVLRDLDSKFPGHISPAEKNGNIKAIQYWTVAKRNDPDYRKTPLADLVNQSKRISMSSGVEEELD